MIQVRTHVFETNSSMTHTIVMCKDEEYKKFINGEYYFNEYLKPQFLPKDEALKYNAKKLREILEDVNKDDSEYENETIEALTEENIKLYEEGKFDIEDFYLDNYEISDVMYFDYEYFLSITCEYYEQFSASFNGVTAFGYYGHEY